MRNIKQGVPPCGGTPVGWRKPHSLAKESVETVGKEDTGVFGA